MRAGRYIATNQPEDCIGDGTQFRRYRLKAYRCAHLNYLLYSPFRYAHNNPHASRFRRADAPEGVFYASASPETALAEIVFYRLLFYAESPTTPLPGNPAEYSAFAVQMRADPALDLTGSPMHAHLRAWTDPGDYSLCHTLADEARAESVQAICYPSARDVQHRLNYALLTPKAFAQAGPIAFQSWHILLGADSVLAKCEAPDMGLTFARGDFDVESRLEAESGKRRRREN